MKNSLFFLSFPMKKRVGNLLGKPSRPHTLTLAVTYRCQSRCRTCRIWEIYQKNKKRAKEELQAWDYLPLFENLKNDLVHLTITGGEPFLKKDLEEIIVQASQKLKNLTWISITTNGLSPRMIEAKTKRLLEIFPGNLSIEVSLDGDEKLHDQIRGFPGSYKRAHQTFVELENLAKKNPRLHTFFSYTISAFNVGRFEQFFQSLKKDLKVGVERVSINLEHQGLLYHRKGSLLRDQDFQEKLKKDVNFISRLRIPRQLAGMNEARKKPTHHTVLQWGGFVLKENKFRPTFSLFLLGKNALRRFYVRNLPHFVRNPKEQILPCSAASCSFFIDPYGNIFPCTIWEKRLGNIKNLDFKKFWDCQLLKKTREEIKKGGCPVCFSPCEVQVAFLSNFPLSLLKA